MSRFLLLTLSSVKLISTVESLGSLNHTEFICYGIIEFSLANIQMISDFIIYKIYSIYKIHNYRKMLLPSETG